jgi:hypothetical protein
MILKIALSLGPTSKIYPVRTIARASSPYNEEETIYEKHNKNSRGCRCVKIMA